MFADLVRMPDDQRDALHLLRQIAQCCIAGMIETVAQQQVFRRIAAQAEFRRKQDRRALLFGALCIVGDLRGITGEVADGAIDLCDGDLHALSSNGCG